MRTEIVEPNTPLAIALFNAITAACGLPDHEERRSLVRELTRALMYHNNPLVMYEDKHE